MNFLNNFVLFISLFSWFTWSAEARLGVTNRSLEKAKVFLQASGQCGLFSVLAFMGVGLVYSGIVLDNIRRVNNRLLHQSAVAFPRNFRSQAGVAALCLGGGGLFLLSLYALIQTSKRAFCTLDSL